MEDTGVLGVEEFEYLELAVQEGGDCGREVRGSGGRDGTDGEECQEWSTTGGCQLEWGKGVQFSGGTGGDVWTGDGDGCGETGRRWCCRDEDVGVCYGNDEKR